MSEDIRDDARRKVTSVGNSWIVCKSKSYSGHLYYFNTLTGEAAWNLSDAEIEKAKNRTKHLECLPGAKPTRCPEPKDKPPSTLNNSKPVQRVFHEPFAINTFSEQQSSVSTFTNNNATFDDINQLNCTLNNSKPVQRVFHEPFAINTVSEQQSSDSTYTNNNATFDDINQIAALMQTQINNPPSVNSVCKINSFNNTISTFNLNTSPAIYNPNVWAIPQTQPIFIRPPPAPVVNHSPRSLNIAYNKLVQSLSQPASGLVLNSLDNASPPGITVSGTRSFYPRHFNYGKGQRILSKRNIFANKMDLRQKLSAKKRFNTPSGTPGGVGLIKHNQRKADISAHIGSTIEGIQSHDVIDRTLEKRCLETRLHEGPTRLDLGPLKSLAPPDSNTDAWFIVVDLDVLLNEFKFLNSLTDSDEACHLMVPKRVMEELKAYVTGTENVQVRRILRFLSHRIEIGYAFMAEEPSEVEGESMAEVIHATCILISENKYHLILLSNDTELLNFKESSSIKMFSIDEVKNLLIDNPNKQLAPLVHKKPFMIDELINKIKIVVPNDAPQNKDRTGPVRDIQLNDKLDQDIVIANSEPKQNNTKDKTEESTVLKQTVDAGIQTDFEDINASFHLPNKAENRDLNTISNTSQNTNETLIRCPVPSVLNVPDKKREIRLKRSTSNQPQVPSIESEKKRFKWRRRRNTTPQLPENTKNQNNNLQEVESLLTNTVNGDIRQEPDNLLSNNNSTFVQHENYILEDSIESRESSIYADQKNKSAKHNVTIEETSTSGIISNTESNVDAESSYSNSTVNQQQQSVDNEPSENKPMYEIDSISMAEYLKMKCDEWVSRYIQIMEEVLSQVLQQEPPFSHSEMPPPWTLHEAAQCVAIKFSTHQDIKGAANKLSIILFLVSDAKGKITMNMTPHQYMQMYSYGVHLLAAIMKVTNNCEDIQIAADSLKKLLDDIRNPNMDSSTNDTFNDNDQHLYHSETGDGNNPQNNTTAYTDVPDSDNLDNSTLHEQTEEEYNLRSKKRKTLCEELQEPVKFIRKIDIKSSFFKSLSLKKKNSMKKCLNEMNESDIKSHGEQNSQTNDGNHPQNNIEKETDSRVPSNQPTIIRNFSKCPEWEKKLKHNYHSKVYEDHDDDLDYDEDYGEHIPEEFCSEDGNYNEHNDVNVNETNMITDTNENSDPNNRKVVEPLLNNDNSKKLKCMMSTLLNEVKKALCQVRMLCEQCYEELKNPKESTEQKSKLRKMAERAHLHIIRLCRSLESMLDHDTNNQNVRNLFKKVDINTGQVDDRLMMQYRMSVSKCKELADEFLNSIQNIIYAFNS